MKYRTKKYVFVVDKNSVVHCRKSRLRIPDLYVIESGLTANDKIILEGVQK
jgi:membrane fusion protein (multidrug efflux system)